MERKGRNERDLQRIDRSFILNSNFHSIANGWSIEFSVRVKWEFDDVVIVIQFLIICPIWQMSPFQSSSRTRSRLDYPATVRFDPIIIIDDSRVKRISDRVITRVGVHFHWTFTSKNFFKRNKRYRCTVRFIQVRTYILIWISQIENARRT